tara:strand:+ start:794 stop:985 length:192 start_codon:yes stop_codon:yes gene_type:complete
MFEKIEILIVILLLLFAFYFVIALGAGGKKKNLRSYKVSNYLFNVRILIILIGVVSLILWSFA